MAINPSFYSHISFTLYFLPIIGRNRSITFYNSNVTNLPSSP